LTPLPHLATLSQTLHRLDDAHRRFKNQVAGSLALSPTELTALLVTATTPDITVTALAEDLGVSFSTATAVVERLEDAGLVRLVANWISNQFDELQLTQPGFDTLIHIQTKYRTVLGQADTSGDLTRILPELANITAALNAAARNRDSGV
jgi:hypothetical protein